MSPIPSVATAFALSPPAPSITLDPDAAGHSASVISSHLLRTGGFLFAVVALVSVAGYFYHGRGAVNKSLTSNPWTSFSGLFSSMRLRGSSATSTEAAMDWPVDLEAGFKQHVSMVYARHFHPTFWNLVECHPATPSAPAIYVEEEANENPVSDPQPPGRNSFLNIDDDDDDDDDGDDRTKPTRKKPDRDRKTRVKEPPPYDTSLQANVNFNSKIIGTTVRPGAFLFVPGQVEDDSFDDDDDSSFDSDPDFSCSSCGGILTADCEVDFPCSPYDGIFITDPKDDFICSPYDGIFTADPRDDFPCSPYNGVFPTGPEDNFPDSPYDGILTTDSEVDLACSPYDGILPAGSESEFSCSPYDGIIPTDSESEFSCSSYDGIMTTPPRSSSSARRYGMADMAHFAESLKDTTLEEGCHLVSTFSPPTGLLDLSKFAELDPTLSCRYMDRLGPINERTITNCNVSLYDGGNGSRDDSNDTEAVAVPQEGLDMMRRLLSELRDPSLDFTPRALSEDTDSEYCSDDEEGANIPCLIPARDVRRNLVESSSCPGADSDMSDEGPICPLTPPSKYAPYLARAPDVHKDRKSSSVMTRFNGESPAFSDSPLSFPIKAYVRYHRSSRSLLRGPRAPLMYLPSL